MNFEEKPEAVKDFLELKKSLDESLTKTALTLDEKKLDWQSAEENLTMAFEAMAPELQNKYRRNYTDLMEELDHWKDVSSIAVH